MLRNTESYRTEPNAYEDLYEVKQALQNVSPDFPVQTGRGEKGRVVGVNFELYGESDGDKMPPGIWYKLDKNKDPNSRSWAAVGHFHRYDNFIVIP